jgi:hypothetical protein
MTPVRFDVGGCGACQRKFPVGGAAKRILSALIKNLLSEQSDRLLTLSTYGDPCSNSRLLGKLHIPSQFEGFHSRSGFASSPTRPQRVSHYMTEQLRPGPRMRILAKALRESAWSRRRRGVEVWRNGENTDPGLEVCFSVRRERRTKDG